MKSFFVACLGGVLSGLLSFIIVVGVFDGTFIFSLATLEFIINMFYYILSTVLNLLGLNLLGVFGILRVLSCCCTGVETFGVFASGVSANTSKEAVGVVSPTFGVLSRLIKGIQLCEDKDPESELLSLMTNS